MSESPPSTANTPASKIAGVAADDVRDAVDKSGLSSDARVVLDFLARQPARLFRFDEVSDALKMKRNVVEQALADLRNPRYGAPLSNTDGDGAPMRRRWAWLRPDSPVRDGYPPLVHPDDPATQPASQHSTASSALLGGPKKHIAARAAHEAARAAENAKIQAERKDLRRAAAVARLNASVERREQRVKAREVFQAKAKVELVEAEKGAAPGPRKLTEKERGKKDG